MPLNQATATIARVSFGPAVIYLGVMGATPSTELGLIKNDDGVTIELTADKRDITDGNPKLIEYTFTQAQGAMLKFTGIQWNLFTSLWRGLGSGTTSSTGGHDKVNWGGDPLVSQCAIKVVHQMPVSGHTMNVYAWKCVPDAPPKLAFTHDEHAFELAFKVQRSSTDWNGTSLAYNEQLFQIDEQTA